MIFVYRILNLVNQKCYVGSTFNVEGRWEKHLKELRVGDHHSIKLQRAWNKYGESNFKLETLTCRKKEVRQFQEAFYMQKFNSIEDGYNIVSLGLEDGSFRVSEETKKQISLKLAGRPKPPRTEEYRLKQSISHKGKVQSEECKKRKSLKMIGKPRPKEVGLKVSKALLGHSTSEATRKKISEAGKGRKHSLEARAKMSEFQRSKVVSEETKEKIRQANLGKSRPCSEETKEKIRQSMLRRRNNA